jgi:hypothetical protein
MKKCMNTLTEEQILCGELYKSLNDCQKLKSEYDKKINKFVYILKN